MTRFFSTIALTALIAAIGGTSAKAFPPFKEKEGKPCAYCHVNPSGGKRNYRGIYYKMNGLSFANFDDAAEAKKAGVEIGPEPEPKPKSWTAPKGADPAGDGKAVMTTSAAQAKADAAKAAYNKNPKDAAAKKAYAQTLADLGKAQMLDQSMPPAKRYPTALKTLRESVKLDPTNKQAAGDVKLIEDAYKSMGKPVPKD